MEPLFIVGLAKAMSFDIQSCIVAVLMVSLPMSFNDSPVCPFGYTWQMFTKLKHSVVLIITYISFMIPNRVLSVSSPREPFLARSACKMDALPLFLLK